MYKARRELFQENESRLNILTGSALLFIVGFMIGLVALLYIPVNSVELEYFND
ncbi:MAG: hypothetical protein ACFFAS_17945 [Promethearchaeota archaeon]